MSSVCKILIVGDRSVGKTTLFNQIAYKQATPRSAYRISQDTHCATWSDRGNQVKIEVRDTIQTFQSSPNATLCRNLNFVMYMYSVDSKKSIDELIKSYDAINPYIPDGTDGTISCLVGNKNDLVPDENIKASIDKFKKFTNILNKNTFEVSALTGAGIAEMVEAIVRQFWHKKPRVKNNIDFAKKPPNPDDVYCCIN